MATKKKTWRVCCPKMHVCCVWRIFPFFFFFFWYLQQNRPAVKKKKKELFCVNGCQETPKKKKKKNRKMLCFLGAGKEGGKGEREIINTSGMCGIWMCYAKMCVGCRVQKVLL